MSTSTLDLRCNTLEEGLQLAEVLARRLAGTGEGREVVRQIIPRAGLPGQEGQLAAVCFQTVAAANNYWR